jgi:hypothetical protein
MELGVTTKNKNQENLSRINFGSISMSQLKMLPSLHLTPIKTVNLTVT